MLLYKEKGMIANSRETVLVREADDGGSSLKIAGGSICVPIEPTETCRQL